MISGGLRAQLVIGVSGHHHLAIFTGGHGPVNQHGDKRRFSDAVAGCAGQHQRLVTCRGILQVLAYFAECVSLPLARTSGVRQFCAILAPRKRIQRIAQRVMGEAGDIVDQLFFRG